MATEAAAAAAAAAEGAAAAAAAAATAAPAASDAAAAAPSAFPPRPPPPYTTPEALDAHIARAWAAFRAVGAPQLHVAPMVDASELPFRLLCRRHGAAAAYTPMLHARLFLEHKTYRPEHFTTCAEDRPLFVQFCANDPATLVKAASLVQDECDYVDLNLGCPQRIAKKGYYGAFLMDDLALVERLVTSAAAALRVPVSCKVRLFPELAKTIEYARMLERAGCSLLAVHGRTREMKNAAAFRADWDAIRAVRAAVRIPVIANGDVRCLADARALMAHTGADGVMSAEPLLYYPALFDEAMQAPLFERPPAAEAAAAVEGGEGEERPEAAAQDQGRQQQQQQQQQQQEKEGRHQQQQQQQQGADEAMAECSGQQQQQQQKGADPAPSDPAHVAHLERLRLCREYAEACAAHPVHPRMVKGHVHKLLQGWLAEHHDLRERVNSGACASGAALMALVDELQARVEASGRARPAPAKCERKQLAAAREAARRAAIEEQEREAAALAAVEAAAAVAAGQGPPAGGEQQQAADGGGGGGSEPAAKRPCVGAAAQRQEVVVVPVG